MIWMKYQYSIHCKFYVSCQKYVNNYLKMAYYYYFIEKKIKLTFKFIIN